MKIFLVLGQENWTINFAKFLIVQETLTKFNDWSLCSVFNTQLDREHFTLLLPDMY